jgi:hypothetical protein
MSAMILDAVRAHYVSLWGEPSRVIPLHTRGYHIDIYKWDASATSEEVTIYATLGASAFEQPGYAPSHRFEFYTGLLPEKDEMAVVLADVAIYSVKEQAPIGPGHTITFLEPLWPGTRMSSVSLERSDVDLIPILANQQDRVHVEFLMITPLYPSELQFKKDHSLDALIEHWWKHDVAFWDPNRPPEPA